VSIYRIDVSSIQTSKESILDTNKSYKEKSYVPKNIIKEDKTAFHANVNLLLNISNCRTNSLKNKQKGEDNTDERADYKYTSKSKLGTRYPVFVKELTSDNNGLTALGIDNGTVKYSTIVFIPVTENSNNFYAIAMGYAYTTLLPFVDYDFQNKLPEKILNAKGAKIINVKPMIGVTRSKSSVNTVPTSLDNLAYGEACTTYTAEIDNTILDSAGRTRQKLIFPTSKAKSIMVEVGVSRLKFLVKESFANISNAIQILDKIHLDTSDEYLIKDSKLHRVVFGVDKRRKELLDNELEDYVKSILQESEFKTTENLGGFDICFKNPLDYTTCTEFWIKYAGNQVNLREIPDFKTVLSAAHKLLCNNIEDYDARKAHIKESKLLHNIKIAFGNPGDDKSQAKDYPLGQFLRGTFYSIHHKKYFFRFGTVWYTVDDDHIIGVQKGFQEVLVNHLIRKNEFHPLDLKWNPNHDEAKYNNLYGKRNGFYIGDCKTPRGIEYCDVLLDKDKRSYFCHVKKGCDQMTRIVCSQLVNALELLTEVNTRGMETREGLKLHLLTKEEVSEKQIAKRKLVRDPPFKGLSDEEVERLLGFGKNPCNRRIFVMGLFINHKIGSSEPVEKSNKIPDQQKYRSLEAEMDLKQEIPANYIQIYINEKPGLRKQLSKALKCSETEVSEKFESALIASRFVKRPDSQMDSKVPFSKLLVCSKLLLCHRQQDFNEVFSENAKVPADALKEVWLMFQQFITAYESLGAKLEIIRCAKNCRQYVDSDQFKICEIFADLDKDKDASNTEPEGSETKQHQDSGDTSPGKRPAPTSASTSKKAKGEQSPRQEGSSKKDGAMKTTTPKKAKTSGVSR
jgi:hypothetical protein